VKSVYHNRVDTKPGVDNLRVNLDEMATKNIQNTVVD